MKRDHGLPFQNVLYHLMNGRVSDDFYRENKEMLDNTNFQAVKIAYTFMAFLCLVLAWSVRKMAILSEDVGELYLLAGIGYGLLAIVTCWFVVKNKHYTRAMYYLFETITYTLVIVSETYYSSGDRAVLFFMVLIAIPLLYVERPIISIATSTITCVIFGVVTMAVKGDNPEAMWMDIFHAFLGLLISAVFIYYIRNLHLSSMQAALLLEIKVQTDGLTGLLNKVSTQVSCQRYLEYSTHTTNCAIIMIDIDDFKHVNDYYGHKQGDVLLARVGGILGSLFRECDIVGRIGGDEFLVLMRDIENMAIVEYKAKQINEMVKTIFHEYSEERITCSIGIAQNIGETTTFSAIYGKADKALYQAKKEGKQCYVIYSEDRVILEDGKPAVLIVDDSEVGRAILSTCLEDEYAVLEAEDGQQAMEYLYKYGTAIGLILLDIEMPVMNGYEVLKFVKADEELKDIPILLITAYEENERKALEYGVEDVIIKPYDPMTVKKRVEKFIRN